MYLAAEWETELESLLAGTENAIYGDSGFTLSKRLHRNLTRLEAPVDYAHKNRCMSSVRIAVEWAIGDIKSTFAFVKYPPRMKAGAKQAGNYMLFGTLLQNIRVCVEQTSRITTAFGLSPPTLEEYLPLDDG